MTGDFDDLLGELLDVSKDEFLDDDFRAWLDPLFPGYGASSLTVASRPLSNLE